MFAPIEVALLKSWSNIEKYILSYLLDEIKSTISFENW